MESEHTDDRLVPTLEDLIIYRACELGAEELVIWQGQIDFDRCVYRGVRAG